LHQSFGSKGQGGNSLSFFVVRRQDQGKFVLIASSGREPVPCIVGHSQVVEDDAGIHGEHPHFLRNADDAF
jgi:hypothetical protein